MLEYRINPRISPRSIAALRRSVGWGGMEAELGNPALRDYLQIACYDGERLIGFLDVVSNGVTDAYIQDVMVHPEYQGKGIGTELMNRAIQRLKAGRIYMISVIYGEEGLRPFYEKFGFSTMLCGQMEARPEYQEREETKP
ncbi:GNAT family N-acetyltransferase [Acutalibacter sp. 1XD8-33]|uniref:GNAT family N-acetyltransferase n=1 Tax=Acutalibacter sp. 1XD8-33 TaxID=2320081 RepID=UPI0018F58CEB|nr:GNAT family N-acetyltransferase [Acutalibacter sp. 1XD8-33]